MNRCRLKFCIGLALFSVLVPLVLVGGVLVGSICVLVLRRSGAISTIKLWSTDDITMAGAALSLIPSTALVWRLVDVLKRWTGHG